MMMLRIGSKEKGFTLAELLISVAILGFGLVIIIQSYMSSVRGLNASQNYIEAVKFAQNKITELEIYAYENQGIFILGAESGTKELGSREFSWISEIKEIENPEYLTEELVEVCVKLDWKEANIAKDAELATYLPRFGLETESE
ncbi:MAG: type II secretion system protein [Candidatus Omnitrophota bacterium]